MPKDSFDEMLKEEGRGTDNQDGIYEQSDSGKPKNSQANEAAAIAFVFFFIAEIIAMAIFAQLYPPLCAACFGLLLLVIGISGVKQTKITWDSWQILTLPLIGLGLTVLPVLDYISQKNTGRTFFTTDHIAILASAFFTVAGLLILIMPFLKWHFMLKICTEKVMAKCIFVDSHRGPRMRRSGAVHSSMLHNHRGHRRRLVYAPKWEYSIGGRVYATQENEYVNTFVPRVGDECEIYVNPNDPNRIYRVNPGVFVVSVPAGIISVAISALTVYFVFFK